MKNGWRVMGGKSTVEVAERVDRVEMDVPYVHTSYRLSTAIILILQQ